MTEQQIKDVFHERQAWEPSPEHVYDEDKTDSQIVYTFKKAKEGNFRYKQETLIAGKICFKDCQYSKLKDCRKLHPTLTEILEQEPSLQKIKEGDFKDYETSEDAFAWFIATLYLYDFSVREAKDAIEEIENEKWINSTIFFKEKVFKKANKITETEKEKETQKEPEKSQADIVYEILHDGKTEFFHDQNRTEYA